MIKALWQDFRKHTVFYTIVGWLAIWALFALIDKFYHNNLNITERQVMDHIRDKFTNESRMKELQFKLRTIRPKTTYLYLDTGMIEVLYSLREFEQYSEPIWRELITTIDKFYKIIFYSSEYPSFESCEKLYNLKKIILNHLHSLIFNIPCNDGYSDKKLYEATENVHYILNFRIEQIRRENNTNFQKNITNNNKYVDKQDIIGHKLDKSSIVQLQNLVF